jgi:hypothetical protein
MEREKSEFLTHIFGSRGRLRAIQLTWGEKSAPAPQFSSDSRFVLFFSPTGPARRTCTGSP